MAASTRKTILLDFDGVVLKKSSAYSLVVNRCEQYVNRFVNIRNPVKVKELNKQLYETYGHTVLGLRNIGFDVTPEEFNRFVYGYFDKTYFRDVRPENYQHIKDFKKLVEKLQETETPFYIFSNAPDIWCKTVLMEMDPSFSKIETLADITNKHLKPEVSCFDAIENILPSDHDIWFVDDKMQNMSTIMNRPRWKKLLYTNAAMDDPVKIKDDLFAIQSFRPIVKSI